jgi:hypothetical protein
MVTGPQTAAKHARYHGPSTPLRFDSDSLGVMADPPTFEKLTA